MAFNTLEYLEKGNVDFVYNLTPYDYRNLIKYVRESDRRVNIVNGFLSKLRDAQPRFCFQIIYDMDEFVDDVKYILGKYYKLDSFSRELFESFLNNSSLGLVYLKEHFDEIVDKYINDLDFIYSLMFQKIDECLELLKQLSLHDNLHIRYLFMKYLILHHSDKINLFYDDITKYLTSETFQENEQLSFIKEYMDVNDVSELAYIYFDRDIDYFIWEKFKQFILNNYKYNRLAFHLLSPKTELVANFSYRYITNHKGIEEFSKDSDRLFLTSTNYRLKILNNYSSKVSKELLDRYEKRLSYFMRRGTINTDYWNLEHSGLVRILEEYVDKYLSLSKDTSYKYIECGSTASCYRIGDYIFKLVSKKWSYEDIICPDLYLILPNLEEVFIRNKDGIVTSGIEVQRYLSRDAKGVPSSVLSSYRDELDRLGYYTTDTLMDGPCGDNCRLLDSYLDSGNLNPPDWFKEYPLVLVDRDRVYKKTNKCPKQVRSETH
ncbi:MAG: hypothetical protein IJE89_01225 [Bacilli bacterium]|nr:hypothetical protein [Bacilli bacterium]